MSASKNVTSVKNRTAAVVAGLGALAVLGTGALAGAGAAHAGAMPVGGSTVAMTLSNHTNLTEYLVGANTPGGQFINAPRRALAPGATEVVTAAGGRGGETVTMTYKIGAVGPKAIYQMVNSPSGANTNATGTTGGNYRVNANVSTGFPHVNAGYDLW